MFLDLMICVIVAECVMERLVTLKGFGLLLEQVTEGYVWYLSIESIL